MSERRQHWDVVYEQRAAESLSWFQANPELSLQFIDAMALRHDAPILDVGAGASCLADALQARGYTDLTLLDLSAHALEAVARRLAPHPVETVVADVTAWQPSRRYALWHDRAVFHFLTEEAQRAAYRRTLASSLEERGHVIIATFALDGPERCSGLPVQRYGVEEIADQFVETLRFVSARREKHVTPAGREQPFIFHISFVAELGQ
jgi:hypothetical protein